MLNHLFSHVRMLSTILVFIIVVGISTFISIPKENQPDIKIPVFYVSLHLDGISPEDSERLMILPVESALKGVEGLQKITSSAYQNGGNIVLEFKTEINIENAYQDIKKELDNVKKDLPNDSDEPKLNEITLKDNPVVNVNVVGNADFATLIKIARKLKQEIINIHEVLDVYISGDRDEIVELILKPEILELYNITPMQISKVFMDSNTLITAGSQSDKDKGKFNIKVPGNFKSVEDILNLPIIYKGNQQIRIRDVSSYISTWSKPSVISRVNGQSSITLDIKKRSGENLLNTVNKVRAVVDVASSMVPNEVKLSVSSDTSKDVITMLTDLENNIFTAIALIMIIIVGALGLRNGLLVGFSIPVSFLLSILILGSLGFSLNTVVLFGLILSIGMLVDGTIVIVEYAQRKRNEGMSIDMAFKSSIRKMAIPIISSTATTLAVFIPLLFWPGIVGEFMKFVPITMIIVLSSSLIIALIFMPMIGIHFHSVIRIFIPVIITIIITFAGVSLIGGLIGGVIGLIIGGIATYIIFKKVDLQKMYTEEVKVSRSIETISIEEYLEEKGNSIKKYHKILEAVLRHPKKILMFTASSLFISWIVFIMFGAGTTFFPSSDPSTFSIQVYSPGNLSTKEKDTLTRNVEQVVIDMNNETNEFIFITTYAGDLSSSRALRSDKIGHISIELQDWDVRRSYKDIKNDLQKRLKHIEGVELRLSNPNKGPKAEKPIEIMVSGQNRDAMRKSIKNIINHMKSSNNFTGIDDSISNVGVDFEYIPNRTRAASLGVSLPVLGQTIRLVTKGLKALSFRPDYTDEQVDVLIKYPKKYRTLSGLQDLRVQTSNGAVALSDILTRKAVTPVRSLNRQNTLAVDKIQSNVAKGVIADTALKSLIKDINDMSLLEKGTKLIIGGDSADQNESKSFLIKAFAFAISLMAVILLTQFNSFYLMGLILVAVIMSTIGVMIGLVITQKPFSIVMSGLAIITLAGIVVNNNIVLIDTFKDMIVKENDVRVAVIKTALSRLRPVFLTSSTTALGLLPTSLGIGLDFATQNISIGSPSGVFWQTLSQNILFGLVFATMLTLIATPCALYAFYKNK